MRSAITRKDDADGAVEAARVIRRLELFRIAVADLVGLIDVHEVGYALTDLNEALIEACAVRRDQARRDRARGGQYPRTSRSSAWAGFGGRELGYASDADVLFVHRPTPGSRRARPPRPSPR